MEARDTGSAGGREAGDRCSARGSRGGGGGAGFGGAVRGVGEEWGRGTGRAPDVERGITRCAISGGIAAAAREAAGAGGAGAGPAGTIFSRVEPRRAAGRAATAEESSVCAGSNSVAHTGNRGEHSDF